MDLHIFLSSDDQYMLKADGYNYTVLPDFKKYGNGYLETEKEYSMFEFLKYESELLKTNVSNPNRFWTSKRYTKVWLIEKDERRELSIKTMVRRINFILDVYILKKTKQECSCLI